MAARYRTGSNEVTLSVPKRGLLRRRSTAVACDLIDLSVDGALIALPAHSSVECGVRLDITIDGEPAAAGVRHTSLGPDGRLRCGLAFRTTTPRFDDAVNASIAAAIDDPRRHDPWRIS